MTPRLNRSFVRSRVRLPVRLPNKSRLFLALIPSPEGRGSLLLLGNGTVGGQAVPLFAPLSLPFQNRMHEPHI
jgi:hypothetical protein